MPKQGEIDYVANLAPEEVGHARDKPFSDGGCGRYLMDLGLVLTLLPPPPQRVLDLGVGSGWTSVLLARRGYDVVGVNLAPAMIELAQANRAREGLANLDFAAHDYESLPWRGEFDAALFYDALHHAEDERSALAAVHRALKPAGMCVTVEPGASHARDPGALAAVARFGVTEKSMPPARIIELGKAVGFRSFEVYERPAPCLLAREPDRAWWRGVRRCVRALLKDSWQAFGERGRSLAGSHVVVLHK